MRFVHGFGLSIILYLSRSLSLSVYIYTYRGGRVVVSWLGGGVSLSPCRGGSVESLSKGETVLVSPCKREQNLASERENPPNRPFLSPSLQFKAMVFSLGCASYVGRKLGFPFGFASHAGLKL